MIYIALLRGINVGGKHSVKMAELRRLFEELGHRRVQTYIQSGNVLFESDLDEPALQAQLEAAFLAAFGFPSSILLRTADELRAIVAGCPFAEEDIRAAEAASDAESLYVAMLPEAPAPEKAARLEPLANSDEAYRIRGRDVYLLFHQSVRNAKLAAGLAVLGVPATTRNWKTMNKLVALADAMEVAETGQAE